MADVPIVIQMEALECGAASLAMVLAYYGKWITLEQARKDCGVSRDGSNAANILKAARRYGLETKAYLLDGDDYRKDFTYPCIIHWNRNHFVVLCGFNGNKAVINDPASGRITVSAEEFKKSFTGVCILFSPSESFETGGKAKSVLPFVRKKLKGTGASFVLMVISTIIGSLIGLIMPAFQKVFTDRIFSMKNPEWLTVFLILVVGVTILWLIASAVETVVTLRVNGKMAIESEAEFMWHVFRLPMDFFFQRMAGDIIVRKQKNNVIARNLVMVLAPIIIQCATLIFYLAILIRYSLTLALMGVASVLINTILARIISKKRIEIARVNASAEAHQQVASLAAVDMIETIKSSGSEDGFFARWAGYQANAAKGAIKVQNLETGLGMIPAIVTVITDTAIFAGSAYLCMEGYWTVGVISAFSGFLSAFLSPARRLIAASRYIQELRTDMERVEDVLEYREDNLGNESPLDEDQEYDKLSGKVELKNVTFGYSRLEDPLIENFSLKLDCGQSVALVGTSGCGKSTISMLMAGIYEPWSGEILYDGIPLKEINRNIFTSSVSVVDQEIVLFADTIENNIKMWDGSIEDFEMILAARDASLHYDIIKKPGGYQHVLEEGGRDLSGGQKQRLEIARVLAEDPRIIIMDEATSALDTQTEYDSIKSIRDRGITCVIVAHRLSTIRDCDEIIVLDKGKVMERGTHDELYALNGLYTALIKNE
ncbi:MAG: NHLP family bacteriocin export ABC transporter peptidase/permease/ATPase subunit [Parasporobacterium sp.]|nr:NHLP family bacteriocin export ABC transporter peptidase/permease/ATPase subunit [Parasporobacterium sp.]